MSPAVDLIRLDRSLCFLDQVKCSASTDRWEVADGQIRHLGADSQHCLAPRYNWQHQKHTNCYKGSGGTPVSGDDHPIDVASIDQCQAACVATSSCQAFVTDIVRGIAEPRAGGSCWLRTSVSLPSCADMTGYDTYQLSPVAADLPLELQPCDFVVGGHGSWSVAAATLVVPPIPELGWYAYRSPHYAVSVSTDEGHTHECFVLYSEPAARDPQVHPLRVY